jgi:hypothetical protein
MDGRTLADHKPGCLKHAAALAHASGKANMIDNTKTLHDLQSMRNKAWDEGNNRLSYSLSIAISELLSIDDRYIDSDITRYQAARRQDPRLKANVKLNEVSRDDDGTIVLAVVPHDR